MGEMKTVAARTDLLTGKAEAGYQEVTVQESFRWCRSRDLNPDTLAGARP